MIVSRRVAGTAIAVAMATGSLFAAAPANAAPADPGFCGVRHADYQVGFDHVYVVRNQCGQSWNFAVNLPDVHRWTRDGCKTVHPGEEVPYVDAYADGHWAVVNC